MDKVAFELKADLNSFQTWKPDGSGEFRIEGGEVYVTGDANEIAALRAHAGAGGALKEVAAPDGARSKAKVEKE